MPTGQDLGDFFAAAGGSPVNRPQLNAFVANSQARNGLVSAQTQEAMIKAAQAQEEMTARDNVYNDLIGMGAKPSDAMLGRDIGVGALGNAEVMAKALGLFKLGYGTPDEQVRGHQMATGNLATPPSVPGNYLNVPGTTGAYAGAPPVQQTPEAQTQTAAYGANATLHGEQAAHPELFHPGAGPVDPNMVDFGGYMLYKTGKMPAMGMGGGPARAAIISHAAQLSQAEANGQTITNPGYDTAIANGQDFTSAQRNLNSMAGGPLGNQVRAVNNVVGHLQLMEQLFTSLQNGDVQAVNKLGNAWNKAFGAPAPTNIQTAAEFIGPELTKILSANSSTGTAEERQGFANTAANLANAPEQTTQAIGTLKNMLGRQLTDMALQYHGATGRSDFTRRYVAPDVAQYLEIAPEGGPPAPAPGTPPTPAPTSTGTSASPAGGAATTLPPQALAQLKEGMHTTFANHQVWTLQNGKPVRVQ